MLGDISRAETAAAPFAGAETAAAPFAGDSDVNVDPDQRFDEKGPFKRLRTEDEVQANTVRALNTEITELTIRLRALTKDKNDLVFELQSLKESLKPLQKYKEELLRDIQEFVNQRRQHVPEILKEYFLRSQLFWVFTGVKSNLLDLSLASRNFLEIIQSNNLDLYNMCTYYQQEFINVINELLRNYLTVFSLISDKTLISLFTQYTSPIDIVVELQEKNDTSINIATYAQFLWVRLQTTTGFSLKDTWISELQTTFLQPAVAARK